MKRERDRNVLGRSGKVTDREEEVKISWWE